MKATKWHVKVNIETLLDVYKGEEIDILEDGQGHFLSDSETRSQLDEWISLGYKLIPIGDKCEGFDPFGGGCPGHSIE